MVNIGFRTRSPKLLPARATLQTEGLEALFLGSDLIGDRSDYVAFRDREIPFLFFTCGENRDYHRPSDTLENLDLKILERQLAGIRTLVEHVAALEARPPFLSEPVRRREEAEDFLRFLDAFLEIPQALPEPLRGVRQLRDNSLLKSPHWGRWVARIAALSAIHREVTAERGSNIISREI